MVEKKPRRRWDEDQPFTMAVLSILALFFSGSTVVSLVGLNLHNAAVYFAADIAIIALIICIHHCENKQKKE